MSLTSGFFFAFFGSNNHRFPHAQTGKHVKKNLSLNTRADHAFLIMSHTKAI